MFDLLQLVRRREKKGKISKKSEAKEVKAESNLIVVNPHLIAFRSVARVQNDVFTGVIDTNVVSSDFAVLTQEEVLIAALLVTRIQTDRLVDVRLATRSVQAHLGHEIAAQVSNLFQNGRQEPS
jgi:hypothetical protein